MKKHNFPHFGELTLDVADVKKQELKKSFPQTNSVDKLGAKRDHYNTMMNSTYADSEMPYGAQYQSTDYVKQNQLTIHNEMLKKANHQRR